MQILFQRPMDDDGVEFFCPCHNGTQFVLYTKANVPYASCPVCGAVCEPRVRVCVTIPFPVGQVIR